MKKTLIFCFLINSCIFAKDEPKELVRCGTEDHYKEWSQKVSKLTYLQRFILIDRLHATLHKAQREMIESLLKTPRDKMGPQSFKDLALFSQKLEDAWRCSDGLSWVEQMTQTGIVFDCGERDCRHSMR